MQPRLRHFALRVSDLERSATFYEKVFGFNRVAKEVIPIGAAVYLSDGVVNLALVQYFGEAGAADKRAAGTPGSDHFGIQVEDMAATQALIESAGGSFYFDLGDEKKGNFERKFKDPDGIVFDISNHGWVGTDGRDFPGDK